MREALLLMNIENPPLAFRAKKTGGGMEIL